MQAAKATIPLLVLMSLSLTRALKNEPGQPRRVALLQLEQIKTDARFKDGLASGASKFLPQAYAHRDEGEAAVGLPNRVESYEKMEAGKEVMFRGL